MNNIKIKLNSFHKHTNLFSFSLVILVIYLVSVISSTAFGTDKITNFSNLSRDNTALHYSSEQKYQFGSTPTGVVFPFVKSNAIYLYDDGEEKLLVVPQIKPNLAACTSFMYPSISPDKKFVAYIAQNGNSSMYGCYEGVLKYINLISGEITSTNYIIESFDWNHNNQIEFKITNNVKNDEDNIIDEGQSYNKFVVYDHISQNEIASETVFFTEGENVIANFPIYKAEKKVRINSGKFYLISSSGLETYLFDTDRVSVFQGFSPDGRFAVFKSTQTPPENSNPFSEIWYIVDTNNTSYSPKEILVTHGAAGGQLPAGLKWLFNDAFVIYCSETLYFINGKENIELTDSSGGGCHNEEGFVANSPNRNYAFLKFSDHFELRSLSGETTVIQEEVPITKTRWEPKNLFWLDDNNMIMFQSIQEKKGDETTSQPIYLYNKQDNIIKKIVDNGYLISY